MNLSERPGFSFRSPLFLKGRPVFVFPKCGYHPSLGKIWQIGGFVRKYFQNSHGCNPKICENIKNGVAPLHTPTPTMLIRTTPRLGAVQTIHVRKATHRILRASCIFSRVTFIQKSGLSAVPWDGKTLTFQSRSMFRGRRNSAIGSDVTAAR